MHNHLIDNRHIRVFISSTFRDMQDERDYLMKRTFPKLRKLAAERDVILTEVDLRWGITEEESKSGKVVEICLREIENSIPFFIGIIGNRYGWVPTKEELDDKIIQDFSCVEAYLEKHISVTEMEMRYGALERKEPMHAHFFIKAQEEVRDEGIGSKEKLDRLKKQVILDDRYDVCSYTSVDELGAQVEQALTHLLDELFPQSQLTNHEKEAMVQRAYIRTLSQTYIKNPDYFEALDKWVETEQNNQMMIVGKSGLGKSALLANWIKERNAKDASREYIYYFVGNNEGDTNKEALERYITQEIYECIGEQAGGESSCKISLQEAFDLANKQQEKRFVVIIDGIDQIGDNECGKSLNWLPAASENIKMACSAISDEIVADILETRGFTQLTLNPLSKEERGLLIEMYLQNVGKKIEIAYLDRILNDTQCQNTRILLTLLERLRCFGVYEEVGKKIDNYIGKKSPTQFYGCLLADIENDFGKEVVKKTLASISLSKQGLAEHEIIGITDIKPIEWSLLYNTIGSHLICRNGLIVFSHALFRKAVERRYLSKQFACNNYRAGIYQYFGKNVSEKRTAIELPYQLYKINYKDAKQKLYEYLTEPTLFTYSYNQNRDDVCVYWSQIQAKGYSMKGFDVDHDERFGLQEKAIAYERMAFVASGSIEPELYEFFINKSLELNDMRENLSIEEQAAECIKKAKLIINKEDDCSAEESIKAFNLYNDAIRLLEAEDIVSKDLAISYSDSAYLFSRVNFGDDAKNESLWNDLLRRWDRALEINEQLYGEYNEECSIINSNVGMFYLDHGQPTKALPYILKAAKISEIANGTDHYLTGNIYDVLGQAYSMLGETDKALEAHKKAYKILSSLFPQEHPDVKLAKKMLDKIKTSI